MGCWFLYWTGEEPQLIVCGRYIGEEWYDLVYMSFTFSSGKGKGTLWRIWCWWERQMVVMGMNRYCRFLYINACFMIGYSEVFGQPSIIYEDMVFTSLRRPWILRMGRMSKIMRLGSYFYTFIAALVYHYNFYAREVGDEEGMGR
ncbi:hypothetical protein C5167_015128 [Papaver somniferum]|uniref:Uncharacterized protein n=1 Tax=Papaver somniferum TaxID=3469 RepID=A0A4Y7J608_PAPSO|nr:hypothetical protein C5167_015128 [Papaver somniferum]